MASRRKPASFRPLSSLPRPRTPAAQEERRLRELEAEETAQDALRFARDIQRRQALERAAAQAGDPHHAEPPLRWPEDEWEDIPPRPEDMIDELDPHAAHPNASDPILLSLHEQAKQLKRKKLLDNWEAQYATLFDSYLETKQKTKDWSTAAWNEDLQPACNCGTGLVRERQVVLVDIHGMMLVSIYIYI